MKVDSVAQFAAHINEEKDRIERMIFIVQFDDGTMGHGRINCTRYEMIGLLEALKSELLFSEEVG